MKRKLTEEEKTQIRDYVVRLTLEGHSTREIKQMLEIAYNYSTTNVTISKWLKDQSVPEDIRKQIANMQEIRRKILSNPTVQKEIEDKARYYTEPDGGITMKEIGMYYGEDESTIYRDLTERLRDIDTIDPLLKAKVKQKLDRNPIVNLKKHK